MTIESSFLKSASFDNPTNVLILELQDGTHLKVPDVSREHYNHFLAHRSQGTYFNTHFKHKAVPHKPAPKGK